jgi:hypothetical protein
LRGAGKREVGDLPDEKEVMKDLEHVGKLTDRLEEDPEEDEAVALLEEAVDKVERLGKDLEESGS